MPHRFFHKKLRVYIILLIVFDMFRILTARLFVQKSVIAYVYRIEKGLLDFHLKKATRSLSVLEDS